MENLNKEFKLTSNPKVAENNDFVKLVRPSFVGYLSQEEEEKYFTTNPKLRMTAKKQFLVKQLLSRLENGITIDDETSTAIHEVVRGIRTTI